VCFGRAVLLCRGGSSRREPGPWRYAGQALSRGGRGRTATEVDPQLGGGRGPSAYSERADQRKEESLRETFRRARAVGKIMPRRNRCAALFVRVDRKPLARREPVSTQTQGEILPHGE